MDGPNSADALRVDRVISHMSSSESDIMVLCQSNVEVFIGTTGGSYINSQAAIAASDDFQSFAQQFTSASIRDVRYEIYDQNPSLVVNGYWSTFHTMGNTPSSVTLAEVVDRPDASVVPVGTGKASLTWSAHTVGEKDFYPIPLVNDFGGLSAYFNYSGQAISGKYLVLVKALVHFRGRK